MPLSRMTNHHEPVSLHLLRCLGTGRGVFVGMDFHKRTFEYDKIIDILSHAFRMLAADSQVKKVPVGDNKVWLRDMVREVKTFERALDSSRWDIGMRDRKVHMGRVRVACVFFPREKRK